MSAERSARPGAGWEGAGQAVRLRRVRLRDLGPDERRALTRRSAGTGAEVREGARRIIVEVREGGDAALRTLGARLGGAWTEGSVPDATAQVPIRVPRERLAAAADALDPALRDALRLMARNIETFHRAEVPAPETWVDVSPGIRVGRVWRALDRIGVYVPGGEAAYPSSLLMGVIPARLAGVREIAVASPAGRDGRLSPVLLGAAGLVGIDEFYAIGGAQAIAALAYGTETVTAVDRIIGPGNAWVTAAKIEVLGDVGIDLPAGPSEVMVLADSSADPAHVAADLMSQAEHGPDSAAVLVAVGGGIADAAEAELARQLPLQPRLRYLASSLRSAGLVVVADGLDDALAFLNEYAPEHLSVAVRDAEALLPRIRHAGSVFLGAYAPESAGDYATGSNHVLPTGRLARAYGPLSVEDCGHWMQAQVVDRAGLASIAPAVAAVAEAEGLSAHRHAVEIRFAGTHAGGTGHETAGSRAHEPGAATAGGSSGPDEAATGYQWEPSDAEIAERYGIDPASVVRFDTNTSPRTPDRLPEWLAAAQERAHLNEYPDASYARLTRAVAAYAGVPADRVVVGAGADEMLDLVAKVCLPPGGTALVPVPTYAMYGVLTAQRPARVREVPRRSASDGRALDVEALPPAAASADLLWLCDPNNPTGTMEATGVLAALLERLAALPGGGPYVALDEAYREFAGESLIPRIAAHPRLVVVRTVSKAFGLAGIRVGYAIAQPGLAARLNAVRPPGSISTLSAAIAAAALGAPDLARANVARLVAERERLAGALRSSGWSVPASVTNFIVLDAGSGEAADAAAERLLRAGIVPRRFGPGPMRASLRLTVRSRGEDDRLIEALGAAHPDGGQGT